MVVVKSKSDTVYVVFPLLVIIAVTSAKAAKNTRVSSNASLKVLSAVTGMPFNTMSKSPLPEPAQYKYAAITFWLVLRSNSADDDVSITHDKKGPFSTVFKVLPIAV